MRLRSLLLMAIVGVSAAGCSGGGEAKPAESTRPRYVPVVPEAISEGTGACGLLNQAEISAAVGLPAEAGTGTRSGGRESCKWTLRGPGAQYVGLLALAEGASGYDQTLSTAPRGVEQVSGLGDRAFAINDAVWVVKGDRLVTVQVVSTQPLNARRQGALTLARAASARG